MPAPTERTPLIDLKGLESRIRDRSIDTVISAITDLQGRLMAPRPFPSPAGGRGEML